MLTQQKKINSEIKTRTQASYKYYFRLMELLRFKASSVNFKIKINKALIKLVLDLKSYIRAQVYYGRHYQETTHLGKARIRAGRKKGPRKCRSPN